MVIIRSVHFGVAYWRKFWISIQFLQNSLMMSVLCSREFKKETNDVIILFKHANNFTFHKPYRNVVIILLKLLVSYKFYDDFILAFPVYISFLYISISVTCTTLKRDRRAAFEFYGFEFPWMPETHIATIISWLNNLYITDEVFLINSRLVLYFLSLARLKSFLLPSVSLSSRYSHADVRRT